jgi:hypothetical protein
MFCIGVEVCYSKGRIVAVLLFLDYTYSQDGVRKFLHNTGNYLPVDIFQKINLHH